MDEDPEGDDLPEPEDDTTPWLAYLLLESDERAEARRSYALILALGHMQGRPAPEVAGAANLFDLFLRGELPDMPSPHLKVVKGDRK